VGGAKVFYAADNLHSLQPDLHNPLNVTAQMATKASISPYEATDLVLIDGGGNDAAAIVTAFVTLQMAAGTSLAANAMASYQTLLGQQLDGQTITQTLQETNGEAVAAHLYMRALANTFYDGISTYVLENGAQHVGILNIPDITMTPSIRSRLDSLSAENSVQLQAAIQDWVVSFNEQVKSRAGNDPCVAVVDFYTDFQDTVSHPSDYSLTNANTPACTAQVGVFGNFPCLSTTLDADSTQPAGWWKRYAFSDDFHPTPYGHQLMASSVARALARAGWL
jgi:outer membrane lipase/esterase